MLVWAIGTIVAVVGVAEIMLRHSTESFFLYLSLSVGGFVAIIISETVFGMNKTQVEMDRDETIKTAFQKNEQQHEPATLAICWNCKSRVPTDSKYCLECGADLKPSVYSPRTS